MTIFRTISSAIFSLMVLSSTISFAQDRFDVDDVSAHSGYRGYTTYRSTDQASQVDGERIVNRKQDEVKKYSRTDEYVERSDGREDVRSKQKEDVSRLEKFYRERTGVKDLKQFGYDLFYAPAHHVKKDDGFVRPSGAVQDDYIVQSGDELFVIFSGERKERKKYNVGSDGRLLIDGFTPIHVMGRTLGDVKNEMNVIAEQNFYRGDIDISVSGMKQIGVLVAGHVRRPGRHNLNVSHSVLDALSIAGGVRQNGTLRNIKLIRNGRSQYIDLYKYYGFENNLKTIKLRDGDRLIVPPIGDTFSVVGGVREQGVFELSNNQKRLRLDRALDVSGGLIGDGDYTFSLSRAGGKIINLNRTSPALISNGSILKVMRSKDRLQNAVELKGYSRRNGVYDIARTGTLSQLIGGGHVLADDTYPLMGVVSRLSSDGFGRKLMSFSPQSIVNNGDDRQLESGDIVYLFSRNEIQKILKSKKENGNKNSDKKTYPKQIKEYIL